MVCSISRRHLLSVLIAIEHTHSHGHSHEHPLQGSKTPSIAASSRPNSITGVVVPSKNPPIPHRRPGSPSQDTDAAYSHYGHPAATRGSLVLMAQELAQAQLPSPTLHHSGFSQHNPHNSEIPDIPRSSRRTRSMSVTDPFSQEILPSSSSEGTPLLEVQEDSLLTNSHSHSHAGSMNMRALVLHVLGDALGNVGVIATGLVIWKTSWPFKYYFDPIVSLVITLIIFSSALPLGKSVKSSTLARLLLNDLDSAQRLLHSPSGSPFDCFPK